MLLVSCEAYAACPGAGCGSITTGDMTTWGKGNRVDIYAPTLAADGTTSDDAALAALITRCNAVGGLLHLPTGTIKLTGAAQSKPNDCKIVGSGPQAWAGTNGTASPGAGGTTFMLTSTTVAPFIIGNSVTFQDVNFWWPIQDGTVHYPPAITDSGNAIVPVSSATVTNLMLDHVTFVNCWDCIADSATVNGWGNVHFTDVTYLAAHDAFAFSNIGDGFVMSNLKNSAGPWLQQCASGDNSCFASLAVASAQNRSFHIKAHPGGGIVSFSLGCGSELSGATGFLIDANAVIGNSIVCANWDGTGIIIDASASGAVWNFNNVFIGSNSASFIPFQNQASFTGTISGTTLTVSGVTGIIQAQEVLSFVGQVAGTKIISGSGTTWTVNNSQSVGPVAMTSTLAGNNPCFKMGSGSLLFLNGFLSSGCQGDFITTSGSGVRLVGVESAGIGSIADGQEYYHVHVTAGTPDIYVRDTDLGGMSCSNTPQGCHHVHGVTTGVQPGSLIIQNNTFGFLEDAVNIIAGTDPTTITGNTSVNTNSASPIAYSMRVSGSGGVMYGTNNWDKPPIATPLSCGSGCSVAAGTFRGVISMGTGSITSATFTLPFVPVTGLPSGAQICTAQAGNPATGALSCSLSGAVMTIGSSGTNMSGIGVTFDATPIQ